MTSRRLFLLSANLVLVGVLVAGSSVRSEKPDGGESPPRPIVGIDPEITASIKKETAAALPPDIGFTLFRSAKLTEPEVKLPEDPMRSARLLGVIQSRFNEVAIVAHGTDASPIRLRLGGKVDGWLVSQIGKKSVTLERAGDQLVLTLDSTPPTPSAEQ